MRGIHLRVQYVHVTLIVYLLPHPKYSLLDYSGASFPYWWSISTTLCWHSPLGLSFFPVTQKITFVLTLKGVPEVMLLHSLMLQ